MKLIYVNEIGEDYKGQKQYEFIFSNSTEIDMDEWFVIPASLTSQSKSPRIEYIDLVGLLKNSDLHFELVQNSDYFGVIDAVDGTYRDWETLVYRDWETANRRTLYRRPCPLSLRTYSLSSLSLTKSLIVFSGA